MKTLLVYGDKTFKITVPDDTVVTFGPWSPPTKDGRFDNGEGAKRGTLRIYRGKSKTDILACFAGVQGFRDLTLGYAEEVAREEGATIWKDDEHGYLRESKVKQQREWVQPELPPHVAPTRRKR